MAGDEMFGEAGETSEVQHTVPRIQRTVRRARILNEIGLRSREVSATVVVAPDGFGKTTLLRQRVADVQADVERGVARMFDASGMDGEGLFGLLGSVESSLEHRMRPLVAIDNLPVLRGASLDGIAERLRALRAKGFEFIVACRPNNSDFVNRLGDSHKVGPQTLVVRPKEYPEWARLLGVAGDFDVYGLTQGIPGLVAMLGVMDGRQSGIEMFSDAVSMLYQGVLGDLRRDRDALYRMACLLLLTGSGSFRDFDRIGMRVRTQSWTRLAREYPVFGIDVERGAYRCLFQRGKSMGELGRSIVRTRPLYAVRAIKVLMASGDVDRAVYVARMFERPEDAVAVLAEHPAAFALTGNIDFVRDLMGGTGDISSPSTPVGAVLAMYLSALAGGELRLARALNVEIRRREREIPEHVDPGSWSEARAFSDMWASCRGVSLPQLDSSFTRDRETPMARDLALHNQIYGELVGGSGAIMLEERVSGIEDLAGEAVSVPQVLLACDRVLVDALCGDIADIRAADKLLQHLVDRLMRRRLVSIATHVRMVSAVCRLLAGLPVPDERALIDAGTMSVRTSDLATQLFCLAGEGWQDLGIGQYANALFRARQVLKLADGNQRLIVDWARMLECCSHVLNTSRMTLEEEIDLLDLSEGARDAVDAWTVALQLAAARRTSELSAWYSLNRELMMAWGFSAFARQAIALMGDRVDVLVRMLPDGYLPGLNVAAAEAAPSMPSIESRSMGGGLRDVDSLLGQVNVRLFGGFQVERGGHVVTDSVWRRRKACIIAARLVLASGAFVGRKELGEEVWPDKDYLHAREALYAGLTSLRSAFGQSDGGPQYVLTQGEGVAINTEYVVSDTMHFEALARDILLRRMGTTGRQLVEACLRLEELYAGPLYVPNFGDSSFFVRQRRAFQMKFIDCMMRGVAAALELDDLPVASWLVEAALRQAPMREDVIRAAMHIYDKSGRRREVVELYSSHVHILERELHSLPEKETQMAYEAIIQRDGKEVMLA